MGKKLKIIPKDHSYHHSNDLKVEEKKIESKTREIDLFNNPMVDAAKRSMSSKDIEEYQRLGEKYYAGWDFEKGGPEEMLDVAVAELSEAIKSGLHPSDLDENEKEILRLKLGKEWYNQFGFTEDELTTIKI
jgi:hypothetical protein